MPARNRREAEIAVVRPAQPRTTLHAVAGATERRLPGAMEVPIEQVSPDPGQPRQDWEHNDGARHLDELTESVREFGILQPLVVREDGTIDDGRQRYSIIAGGRRYAAARRAGLTTVPVIVRGDESSRVRILQLIENLQRHELSPLDEARAYQELIDIEKLSPPMLAARLHLSAQHVRDRLRILTDQVLADAVERRQISATAARDIMQLPNDELTIFRDRVSDGETIQTSDVTAVRARLAADGVVNPRRKRAMQKKQTSFVPPDALLPLSDVQEGMAPSTGNWPTDHEGASNSADLRSDRSMGECSLPESFVSLADMVARLIDEGIEGSQRDEIVSKMKSPIDARAAEEWWLLVYQRLRERLFSE
jgi:ParB family transcriptional regulator, chromosome partitioning protein